MYKIIGYIKIFKDALCAFGFVLVLLLLYYLIEYGIAVSNLPDWFKFALLK